MKNVDLKPCPFCGGEARLMHGLTGIEKNSFVWCINPKCGATGKKFVAGTSYSSDERAIEFWNARLEVKE